MDWSQIVFRAAIPALILVALTSLVLLLSTDWRISLLALTLQYAGVFFLVLQDWSFEMAATKLVAGWIGFCGGNISPQSREEIYCQSLGIQTGCTFGKKVVVSGRIPLRAAILVAFR